MRISNIASIRSIFILVFSLYCCFSIQKLYFYELEVLIDTKGITEGSVTATTFLNNGSQFVLSRSGEGIYSGEIHGLDDSTALLKLQIKENTRRVEKAWLGEKEIQTSQILHNSDLVGPNWGPDSYYNFVVIKTGTSEQRAPPYWLLLGISIWLLYLFCNRDLTVSQGPLVLRDLVFSGSAFEHLRKVDYLIFTLIFLSTAFVTTGCDALPILNILIPYYSSVDIYQYQVAHKFILDYEFLNWPYNPFFLIFYTFFSAPWATLTISATPILGYQHVQMLGLKTLNFILLLATTLSIISFAIDSGYLKDKFRSVFYLCLLNPLTFYVTVVFLQLDIVPLYLFTVGLLCLTKSKINIFNSAVLLGLGLSCKLQNLLLLGPILLASLLVFIFAEPTKKLIRFFIHSGSIVGILILLTVPFKNPNQAFYHLLSNFSQTDRFWSTLIIYAHDGLFIFMTLLVLILLTLIHCANFHTKLNKSEIIANIFLMMGMIILSFSFAHMNTPSTLIQAGSGLFILCIFTTDPFQRIFLFGASSLMLCNVLFSDVGDITRILGWDNAYFTELYRTMPHQDKVKYSSILFSIANSTMLAFAILMLRTSLGRLNKEKLPT